ncbi:MAG: IPT/TIG domain-containing protein, partial [bacterium]
IGISGTNTQNKPYYSIYTTNFPNAAWFVSYNGGHLKAPTNASGQWDGTTTQGAGPNVAQPTSASTSGLWFGYEWNAFELTLDGNPEDVGDTTYINQFSIPMVLRVFTNSYADAEAGIFTNKDSRNYYKIGGWTNSSISLLSNLVAQMTIAFANGLITNSAGVPVMVAGPSSAGIGALAPPWTPPPLTNNAQNVWPKFTTYFDAVKNAQPGRKAKIKDFIGLAGSGAAPTYYFYYDFDLTVTASNALRLEGSMMVTNSPGASGTFYTNAANLVMELAADAGPNDNWASWSVYTAPTPANLTASAVIFDLINGTPSGLLTNLTAYSSYATNGLGGTPLSITGSNFVGALQVAFCGVNNTLVPAPSFAVVNDTNITVCVPYGAMSGPITITTQYGSGISTNIFTVDATAIQAGPTVTLVAAAPFVTAFSSTSGTPATPVCSVSGDWMAIAQATQTGPTNSNPSLVDLYNSSFGSTIMGRIAGDLAAGFALGFINSDTTNFAYQVNGTNRPYGDSPSGSWWGGNQYTAANTNSLAYHQVNTNCSPWGSLIYAATAVTYGHPIYDRMKFYSGDYSPAAIQPPVAPNSNPNIWMIEVEFLNGMASVASGGGPNSYILTYQPRTGGSISGTATQTVNTGQNGLPVEAVGSDTGVVFHAWSDGRADNPRTDSNVLANITVQAMFYSRGGADLSWYAHYGFTPGPSQQWSDLDSYAVPGKGTTLLMEYVADTNPNEIGSIFQITSFEPGSPLTVQFEYASTSRVYSIKRATDLINPAWVEMTGNMTHIAAGKGQYVAIETNQLPFKAYRMNVAAP